MAESSGAWRKANKRWNEKNKDKQHVYLYRSHTKKFVREVVNEDDPKELRRMINERLSNA